MQSNKLIAMSRTDAFLGGAGPVVMKSLFEYGILPHDDMTTMERINFMKKDIEKKVKTHLEKLNKHTQTQSFQKLANRYGGATQNAVSLNEIVEYVKTLLKDADDEDAPLSFDRAIGLYGGDQDDRKLLGAFLLLFSGLADLLFQGEGQEEGVKPQRVASQTSYSRRDALAVMKDVAIRNGSFCRHGGGAQFGKLKSLMENARARIAKFDPLNARSLKKGTTNDCLAAVNLVKGFLNGTTAFDDIHGTKYGAGENIKAADKDAVGKSSLIFTRLGVVTRLDPSKSPEECVKISQLSNKNILDDLSKKCHELKYKWAHATVALFDSKLRNERFSKINEKTEDGRMQAQKETDQLCHHLLTTVQNVLETACDPPPPLSNDPSLDERRIQVAMIFCMLPMPRDSPSMESSLRTELAKAFPQKEGFIKRINEEVRNRKGAFPASERILFAKALLTTKGIPDGNFSDSNPANYGQFLWKFLNITAVEDPAAVKASADPIKRKLFDMTAEKPPADAIQSQSLTKRSIEKIIPAHAVDMLHALSLFIPLAPVFFGRVSQTFIDRIIQAAEWAARGRTAIAFWNLMSRDLVSSEETQMKPGELEILNQMKPGMLVNFISCMREGRQCPPPPAGLESVASHMAFFILMLWAYKDIVGTASLVATAPTPLGGIGLAVVIFSHQRAIDLAATKILGTSPPFQSTMARLASSTNRSYVEPSLPDADGSTRKRRRTEDIPSDDKHQEAVPPASPPARQHFVHRLATSITSVGRGWQWGKSGGDSPASPLPGVKKSSMKPKTTRAGMIFRNVIRPS